VWSAVIAAAAFAVLAAIVAPFRRSLVTLGKQILFPPIGVTMRVTVDDQFPHVPWIWIEAHNQGWRTVELSSLDFLTKRQWDMPDQRREGVVMKVYPLLPRDTRKVVISNRQESSASLPLGDRIKGFRSTVISARIVTDHSPHYAMGLFPFHLGVVIKWNRGKSQRTLSDIIVSLHGGTPVSSVEWGGSMWFAASPADLRQSANAVLSIVLEGACCPPEVRNVLESLVAPSRP
jgi:hypothetical protein